MSMMEWSKMPLHSERESIERTSSYQSMKLSFPPENFGNLLLVGPFCCFEVALSMACFS